MVTYKQLSEAVAWLLDCRPSEYVLWTGGDVSWWDGPPAWGVNAPLPSQSTVRAQGGFCAAAVSLIHRYLGITIPNPHDDERYDGGIVSYWAAYYDRSEWFSLSRDWPDGTIIMSPYQSEDAGDQGHIAVIWHWRGTPYVVEWIMSDGLTWDYTLEESNGWGGYQIAITPDRWIPGYQDGEAKPSPLPAPVSKEYPGDTADPDVVARWMALVAHADYNLPPVLPVMTSYVELTDAWTGPGDVKSVPGYLNNVDYDSYGYFQQRPSQGWGTYEQVTDATYALHKFCSTARNLADWEWSQSTSDPSVLGRWCQAVQRSAKPSQYRDKGYPAAIELIEGWEAGRDGSPPPDSPEEPEKPEEPDDTGGEAGSVRYGRYTFAAALSDQAAVDITNAAVAALEAREVDCLSLNGEWNIERASEYAVRAAEATLHTNVEPLDLLVVGKATHGLLSERAQAFDGWEPGNPIWRLWDDMDADTLKRVRDWALPYIAGAEGLEPELIKTIFEGVLMAIDAQRYSELLAEIEGGEHEDPPPAPQPEPTPEPEPGREPTLEEKVGILWAEYKKERS